MEQVTTHNGTARKHGSTSWLAAAGLSAGLLFAATKLLSSVKRRSVELQGKVAVITGGSRGLGLALAYELGQHGCQVVLVARDTAELERAAAQLKQAGLDAHTITCDITTANGPAELVSQALAQFGRVDILINDAGMIKVAPLATLQHSDFEEAMNLMFWAPVNLSLAVLPHMDRAGGGHIINIASVGGRVSIPHLLPYSCAKFALVGFSTGLSAELDPEHIHVLTVIPGLMRTGSYLNASFEGKAKQEFAWFSLLGNLPGFSVSVQQSAREIVDALRRRAATHTISLPAELLIQAEALAPEATRIAMQLVNRFALPAASTGSEKTGKSLNPKFGVLFQALTHLGRMAAASHNQ